MCGGGRGEGEGPVLDIAKSTRAAMPAIHVQCTVGGEICVCESLCVSMYCFTRGML